MESFSTLHSKSDERTFLSDEHITNIKSRMNNTLTVWNLRDRKLITFKFLLKLQPWNTKRPHVKTKPKEFSSLCHCYHRVYTGDKCPLRITLLDRFAWKPGHYTSRCMMIYENLTDELSLKRLRRANFPSKQMNILVSLPWRSFQLWREREDTVICRILKLGWPWKFFASWHQTWATLPQKQKFHHERDDVARSHLSLQVCSSLL